jgi:portal protein
MPPNTPAGGSPVEPGIMSRIATGLRYALSGLSPTDFFGPGQPLPPAAQDEAHGRAWDFPVNYNISTRPRGEERIDFPTLRALADNYDLVRLAIETRKDQMGKLRWTVQRRDTGKQDDQAKQIEAFLQTPDGEHDFLDWSRMVLEDLLVIDAPAVFIQRTRGGQVFALEQIDGATIKRVLDSRGRTPAPPDPAYQQIIKGLPATDYSRDELVYKPRNPRIHKVYGYSPVEQLILIVNIGLRRESHQLAFYTAGNVPDMLIGVPATWNPDQIAKYQKYWDQLMAGDLDARRQARFVPGDMKPQNLRPETALFDMFDEWLARVVCYCFSLPPTAFVKQQNRATAESAQEAAIQEGLAPLMEWKVSLMNRLIRLGWNTSD